MLSFTGHPLVDVGVATVTAFSGKEKPEDLTAADLDDLVNFLVDNYVNGKLTPYLSSVFTMNAVYTQPSWKPAKRESEARQLLQVYRNQPEPQAANFRCVYSNLQAAKIAYRQHVPMLTSEGAMNFFPAGVGGLPIAGPYFLALQTLPLGSRRCLGRILAVHSPDDNDLTMLFANKFLKDNRKLMLLASQSEDKYFDAKVPKTLIVNALIEIEEARHEADSQVGAPSVTAYFFTNDGRDPRTELLHLPSEIVSFLRRVLGEKTRSAWKAIVARAWEPMPDSKNAKKQKPGQQIAEGEQPASKPEDLNQNLNPETRRNFLYEDLFSLPSTAPVFIRRYFLRRAYKADVEATPTTSGDELAHVKWDLTHLFLKEIIGMEKSRINAIRSLGDTVADYIEKSDRKLFQRLYMVTRYHDFRNLLIKASKARVKEDLPPIISFDEFAQIFEDSENTSFAEWTLVRDLLLIRIIEQLYLRGWFKKEADMLDSLDSAEDVPEDLAALKA